VPHNLQSALCFMIIHVQLLAGAAPVQNEWEEQNEKIENYGYNFRSLWLTKCSI